MEKTIKLTLIFGSIITIINACSDPILMDKNIPCQSGGFGIGGNDAGELSGSSSSGFGGDPSQIDPCSNLDCMLNEGQIPLDLFRLPCLNFPDEIQGYTGKCGLGPDMLCHWETSKCTDLINAFTECKTSNFNQWLDAPNTFKEQFVFQCFDQNTGAKAEPGTICGFGMICDNLGLCRKECIDNAECPIPPKDSCIQSINCVNQGFGKMVCKPIIKAIGVKCIDFNAQTGECYQGTCAELGSCLQAMP